MDRQGTLMRTTTTSRVRTMRNAVTFGWLACTLALSDAGARGLRRAALRAGRRDRGDVPGWVLITVMTVALVGLLWAVAKEQILDLFKGALNKAKGI